MGQGGKGHKNLVMSHDRRCSIGRKIGLWIKISVQSPVMKRPHMVRRGMNQNTQIVAQYKLPRNLSDVPKMASL